MSTETIIDGEAVRILEASLVRDLGDDAAGAAERDAAGALAHDAETSAERTTAEDAANDGTDRTTPETARTETDDPIDIASGEVILRQTDIELPGILPLLLERTHVSSYRCGRWFGVSWASTLDQRLEVRPSGVYYTSPDAMVLAYPPILRPGVEEYPRVGPRLPLRRAEDGSYRLEDPASGRALHFGPTPGAPADPLSLTAMSDLNGNRIDLRYDDRAVPRELVHSGGYRILLGSERGRITDLSTADGTALLRFEYDEAGHLVEVHDSSDTPVRFTYDAAGRMTGWTDRNGFSYRYDYDDQGRGIGGHGSEGALSSRLEFRDGETVVTDSLGNSSRYRFDERGRVVTEVDPLGGTTSREWDELGRLTSVRDPLGRVTAYAYDEAGNVISVVRPDGGEVRIDYEMNRPVTVREPDGGEWRSVYDARGNLVESVDPAGGVARFAYHPGGGPASIVDPTGAETRVECDPAGLPVTVTDALGGVVHYRRDAMGRVTSMTDPVGGVTELEWTAEGRLRSRRLPSGAVETWTHDDEGNRASAVDAVGAVTRFAYGPFNVVTERISADGGRMRFSHDTELRLVEVTNDQDRRWRYEYDAAGRLVAETDFNGRTVRYSYDAAGQLTGRVNGAGQAVEYERDLLGKVVAATSGDGVSAFTYDRAGRLVRATNSSTDVALLRDRLGRVVAESCNGAAVTSTFDPAGRRIGRRTPSGSEARWRYDALGREVELSTGGQVIRFAYDPAGREVQRTLGSAAVLGHQWDTDHRLTAQTLWALDPAGVHRPRVLEHRAYTLRPDGSVVGINDGVGERRFDLDRVGRVTAVHAGDWTERYAYDGTGNLTAASWPASAAGGEAGDALGDRAHDGTLILRAGNVHFEHDGQGRVVVRRHRTLSGGFRTWRFEWDADDRLTAVTTPGGRRWRYDYDALGRRVAKVLLSKDGGRVVERTDFAWDGSVLAEQTRTALGTRGTTVRATSWAHEPGGVEPLAQVERAPLPERPQEWYDERFYAIVTDQVGAPSEFVDGSGGLFHAGRRTLWGLGDAPGEVDCPLRFPGQYHDAETGLFYNYFRYYDPAVGRYGSPDPLGLVPQPNQYAYVANPLTMLDPFGLEPYKGRKLSDTNPVPRQIRDEYEKIKAMRTAERTGVPSPLDPPTPRITVERDPVTNRVTGSHQTVFEARNLPPGRNADNWRGGLEWDVPGTNHRIVERTDGTLGYAPGHNYRTVKLFPGPWYPEGGEP